jgi:single-stranded-DNA-specific exonuclease
MKEKHIRIEVVPIDEASAALPGSPIQAIGWNLARRAAELGLEAGSVVDLAYRIRENDHPQYGGLQIEIAGIQSLSATETS